MAIIKGPVEIVRLASGTTIGRGFAYLNPSGRPSGSITKLEWDAEPAEIGEPIRVVFADGRTVDAVCTRAGATGCGPEILRFG